MPYKNREDKNRYSKEWQKRQQPSEERKIARRAYSTKYQKANKESIRNSTLLRRYGITSLEFEELFSSQRRCCAICKTGESGGINWCVDHFHGFSGPTKLIRGILCNNCNRMLGYAKDSTKILERASKYLSLQFVA